MKKLLSLLMCYVFLQAETFAMRGGPSNAGGNKVLGYYSGTMVATDGSGNLGLFLLTATGAGASNGQFVIFASNAGAGTGNGTSNSYYGIISGLSDTSIGGTGKFFGAFSGQAVVSDQSATQSVSGAITVSASKTGSNAQRLAGNANSRTLTIFQATAIAGAVGGVNGSTQVLGPLVPYVVDGWQTQTPSTTFTIAAGGGGAGG